MDEHSQHVGKGRKPLVRFSRRVSKAILLILLLRLLAAGWFAYHTPLWEKSDEINHYLYARFLAFEHRLPSESDYPDVPESLQIYVQYNQPPLYYLLLAPIALAFDDPDAPLPFVNPVPLCASPFMHYYVHPQKTTGMDYAAWVGRGLSILMGVLAAYVVFLAGRAMFSAKVGIAGAAFFAFMPVTVELSTWINNDTPLMLLGAFFVYALARQSVRGMVTAAALCILIKLNGLAVIPVLLAAVLATQKRDSRIAPGLRRKLFSALLLLGVIGGFLLLNMARCGAPLCRIHRASLLFDSPAEFMDTLQTDIYEEGAWHFIRSASVPWINRLYQPEGWMLALTWLIFGIGLAGAALRYRAHKTGGVGKRFTEARMSESVGGHPRMARGRQSRLQSNFSSTPSATPNAAEQGSVPAVRRGETWVAPYVENPPERTLQTHHDSASTGIFLLALLVVSAVGLALLRVWWLQVGYMPARYAAVALPGFALLLAAGYDWLTRWFSWRVMLLPVGGFAFLSLTVPLVNYRPLYEMPPRYDDLPAQALALDDFQFESGAQIGGYELQPESVRLYMTTTRPIPEPLFLMILALDADGIVIEKCGITAGGALWSVLDWQSDEWVAQDFPLVTLSEARELDIRLYYLMNDNYMVNGYAPDKPDNLISGGRIALHP